MASRGSSSPSPPPTPSRRRAKSCARRCERACCAIATFFPLCFVYGLTTWAAWVNWSVGYEKIKLDEAIIPSSKIPATMALVLYLLLNACYTIAVLKDPGSPVNSSPNQKRGKYSVLPTTEPGNDMSDVQTITVSSTGSARYCKKCHVPKPDRAHHCSTCKRCVLKMDHHCPWLATCLGLHNYKAFVLFLIYVSLFCWASFVSSATWVYYEMFASSQYLEQFAPVNVIMLAILSGIIGLVISGFTMWHLYLCTRGQTTIECLEKTRYLSGVRRQVEQNRRDQASHGRSPSDLASTLKRAGNEILEFHANAVPGALRFEEGEEHLSPTPSMLDHSLDALHGEGYPQPQFSNPARGSSATAALRNTYTTYSDFESRRESDRYESYLEEKESSALPNAFDLGWRRNLSHLFGPNPWLWWLPVCNTTGDGWRWEVSQQWADSHAELVRRKEERLRQAQATYSRNDPDYRSHLRGGAGAYYDHETDTHDREHSYEHHVHGQPGDMDGHGAAMSLRTIKKQKSRRDFDHGEDGEVASFEVSESEDNAGDSSEDDDTYPDRLARHHCAPTTAPRLDPNGQPRGRPPPPPDRVDSWNGEW